MASRIVLGLAGTLVLLVLPTTSACVAGVPGPAPNCFMADIDPEPLPPATGVGCPFNPPPGTDCMALPGAGAGMVTGTIVWARAPVQVTVKLWCGDQLISSCDVGWLVVGVSNHCESEKNALAPGVFKCERVPPPPPRRIGFYNCLDPPSEPGADDLANDGGQPSVGLAAAGWPPLGLPVLLAPLVALRSRRRSVLGLAAVGLAFGALGVPSVDGSHGAYVGGGRLGGCGAIICEDGIEAGIPPAGVGGVCGVDCSGVNTDCTVTNTSPDAFTLCWDTDVDGLDDTCTGPHVGSGTTGGHKGIVNVYVEVPGTTGFITAVDP